MWRRFALLCLLAAGLNAQAQFKDQTPAGEAPGPWIFATIGVGTNPDKTPQTTALKGLAVKVGEHGEAAVCYDLDLCRMAGACTGGRLVTPMNLMSRGEYPCALGAPEFVAAAVDGFAPAPWHDPRSEPFGPLPDARYRGMSVDGERVVLRWQVGETEVLESPWFEQGVFTRTFVIGPSSAPLHILASVAGESPDLPPGARWQDGYLEVPAHQEAVKFTLFLGHLPAQPAAAPDLAALIKGGPAHWPQSVETKGLVSAAKEAYVVDTVKLPEPNPWGAPMFVAAFDFFPDGRAAVSTFHGDVFIVSGLDAGLEHVTWKRFATGLYHPLGLKIVKGEIYVCGRDGITRLRDLNGDGEADAYEVFNWDVKVTKSFHEFVFDLQTDPDGNFYFAKAGPVKNGGRGFDQICEHHGCLLRVTPDGKKLSVYATGFRAPNGLCVGPEGDITTGDNEGTWVPACRLNWIHPFGFYGVSDLSHWPQPPRDYDRPLCWFPKRVDNSSGGQVWAAERKWGPWSGRLLHLSYGQCTLFGVMDQEVEVPDAPDCCDRLHQGGVVQFPLKFESGIMRARVDPAGGQLYVAGLRGWQTTALKNGCLQRVRYTGAPLYMPMELNARKGGIEVKFSCSLDTQAACDPENWSIEVWNYIWSSAYGSPEVSTLDPAVKPAEEGRNGEMEYTPAQMKQGHHDPLVVKSVTAGTDDRTVFLEIPELKPVMQMSIRYQIRASDGHDLSGEIVNTIHNLPAE